MSLGLIVFGMLLEGRSVRVEFGVSALDLGGQKVVAKGVWLWGWLLVWWTTGHVVVDRRIRGGLREGMTVRLGRVVCGSASSGTSMGVGMGVGMLVAGVLFQAARIVCYL